MVDGVLLVLQYYEMSYGLNVEMHKQVCLTVCLSVCLSVCLCICVWVSDNLCNYVIM